MWNLLFSQGAYAQKQGLALGLSTNAYTAQYRFYSQRSVEIFNIFKTLFTTTGQVNRLVNVLSTFTISPSATRTILSWKNASKYAHVVGVAPYFDCNSLGNDAAAASLMNVTGAINRCLNTMNSVFTTVSAIVSVATSFGLPVMTYEAGQGLVESAVIEWGNAPNPLVTSLLIATNRDPRIQVAYTKYIDGLIAVGAVTQDRPLMHFTSVGNPTKYGSWGALEFTGMQIQTAPKYLALQKYFFKASSPSLLSSLCASGTQSTVLTTGADDYTFVGFPAVTSPRKNQIWVTGALQTVSWDPLGIDIGAVGSLVLRNGDYCRDGSVPTSSSTTSSLILAANVQLSAGSYKFTLPLSALDSFGDGNGLFFVEIKPTGGATNMLASNFSEYFTVEPPADVFNLNMPAYNGSSFHCCQGLLTPDIQYCYDTAIAIAGLPDAVDASLQTPVCANDIRIKSQYAGWIGSCGVNSVTGCREYRTAANFKPVVNCVRQWSPEFATSSYWSKVNLLITNCMNINAPSVSCLSANVDPYCQSMPQYNLAFNWHAPTTSPTSAPTTAPTCKPSTRPSARPTAPTFKPTTARPTFPKPTAKPTQSPTTGNPTESPTAKPSRSPTANPTAKPSRAPTFKPTRSPTESPTAKPSRSPTAKPTAKPSRSPTFKPTRLPTESPTPKPSRTPTRPTAKPSRAPTRVGNNVAKPTK